MCSSRKRRMILGNRVKPLGPASTQRRVDCAAERRQRQWSVRSRKGPRRTSCCGFPVPRDFGVASESRIERGRTWPAPPGATRAKTFDLYRYDPAPATAEAASVSSANASTDPMDHVKFIVCRAFLSCA